MPKSYHGHGGLGLQAGYSEQAGYFPSDTPEGEFIQVPFNDVGAMRKVMDGGDIAAILCETRIGVG